MARTKVKIKRDDQVIVITGKHKGQTGKVLQVQPAAGRVVVEGVNIVRRNVKPQGDTPGGVVQKESSLHISNVAYYNADESRRVKVGWQVIDGNKVRVDRKTGAALDK